jgi:hypothetical protein
VRSDFARGYPVNMPKISETEIVDSPARATQAGRRYTLDVIRLATVIEAVETALHLRHESLPPSSKAILLARLYDVRGPLCPIGVDRLIDSLR